MVREDWYRRLAAANRLVVDARTQVMRLTQQISRLERQGRSTKKPFSQLRGSEQTLVALSDYRAMVLNQVRSYPLPSPRSTWSSRPEPGSNSQAFQMRYRFNFVIDGKRADHPNGAEFNDIVEARAEAIAAARHMMGDWLRHQSGPLPEWLVQIVDANNAVVEVLPADALVYPQQRRARHRRLFNCVHHPYLMLAPDFGILDANPAFLTATQTDLLAISHCPVFDVFPDNPGDPEATGVRNATASLNTVLKHKQAHMMPAQRYDIRTRDGAWEERYWKAASIPVLDDTGEVEFIIVNVEDVTPPARNGRALEQNSNWTCAAKGTRG
jgi:PAS domain-containing protein